AGGRRRSLPLAAQGVRLRRGPPPPRGRRALAARRRAALGVPRHAEARPMKSVSSLDTKKGKKSGLSPNSGFTLIELLVALLVLVLMTPLLVSALQLG